jgi:hypothetical protein
LIFLPSDKNHNWLLRGETWLTNKLSRIFFLWIFSLFFLFFLHKNLLHMYDHWGLINLGCCMLLYLAVLTILFSAAIFCYHKTVLESTAILKRESKLVTLLDTRIYQVFLWIKSSSNPDLNPRQIVTNTLKASHAAIL